MKLVRKADLIEMIGVSETTLDRMVKAERFPPPMRIGARAVAWTEDEVREWIEARKAERTANRDGRRQVGQAGRGNAA